MDVKSMDREEFLRTYINYRRFVRHGKKCIIPVYRCFFSRSVAGSVSKAHRKRAGAGFRMPDTLDVGICQIRISGIPEGVLDICRCSRDPAGIGN